MNDIPANKKDSTDYGAITGAHQVLRLDGADALFSTTHSPSDLREWRALSGATIMMVDDEPTTLDVVQMFLEDAGYSRFLKTTRSLDVPELLERTRPDVLLLDLMMPQLSGFEILERKRMDPALQRIPVIVLTSSTNARDRLLALELGAADFLAKPVDPSELVLRLQNNLAVKAYQDRIRQEQERSERLLLNILPGPVAERLKGGEGTIADSFDEATVLFADIVSFTSIATHTDAAVLVEFLNEVFQTFDLLVEQHGLEKIKTSGDAYMLAGGIPVPRADHAQAVVDLGLAMLDAAARLTGPTGQSVTLRVGVHSGPVVAGVIGRSKFNYDLWGDTVNVASRMESHGVPGQLQVSDSTRRLLGEDYLLEARPPMPIKGKGVMQTFIVQGRRAAARRGVQS